MNTILNKTIDYIVIISRLFVGALFIISGLIKANDTIGFSYKLAEYFSPEVLNLPILEPAAWFISFIICVFEITVGILLIFGYYSKFVTWSLLSMTLFFAFLTFYSAYFNKVADCGCFGDAIKFTPWQSFTKDIILLFFTLILFIKQKTIVVNTPEKDFIYVGILLLLILIFSFEVLNWKFMFVFTLLTFIILIIIKYFVYFDFKHWLVLIGTILIPTIFSYYTTEHLPIKDFRPYSIGSNIQKGMEMPKDEKSTIYKYIYTMTDTTNGKSFEISSIDYIEKGIWKNKKLKISKTSNPLVHIKGYEPPINDFSLISYDLGDDLTELILNEDIVFLLIAYDINKTNKDKIEEIKKFSQEVEKNNIKFYGLSASSYNDIENFKHKHQLAFTFLSCDEITLKTIIRSNPGLVLLKKGTIINKWHINDFPKFINIDK